MPSFEIHKRWVQSALATELYVTAMPKNRVHTRKETTEILASVKETLKSSQASVFQERIFTTQEEKENVLKAYRDVYGNNNNDVPPSILIGKQGKGGALSGMQVHAVVCDGKPEALKLDGQALGRILKLQGQIYVTLSGVTGGKSDADGRQAKKMLENAESILKQLGKDFKCVSRTWMWLDDILSWYGQFNSIRNSFFTQRGLINKNGSQLMPASTGIGLSCGSSGQFGMDLTAVLKPADSIEFLAAMGRQQCALEYGSAFSRASRAASPAGETVFVSGTASINAKGETTYIGDAAGQIEATIENVRAVLQDMNCGDSEVVQAIAYCKNTEVEEEFEKFKKRTDWPMPVVICDICRSELLFELEATAMPGAIS